jgi:hypothetical protein
MNKFYNLLCLCDCASYSNILLKWKTYYCVHKSPLLVPVLSQLNSAHAISSDILKSHCNVIVPSTPTSFKWSLPSHFPSKILYAFQINMEGGKNLEGVFAIYWQEGVSWEMKNSQMKCSGDDKQNVYRQRDKET